MNALFSCPHGVGLVPRARVACGRTLGVVPQCVAPCAGGGMCLTTSRLLLAPGTCPSRRSVHTLTHTPVQVSNKVLLSHYRWPSSTLLGGCQLLFTVVVLSVLHAVGARHVLGDTTLRDGLRAVFPMPLYFAVSVVLGLEASQRLSIPMYGVLQRCAMLIGLAEEMAVVLGCVGAWNRFGKPAWTTNMRVAVLIMVAAALVAAYDDLDFDAGGYAAVALMLVVTRLQCACASLGDVCSAHSGLPPRSASHAGALGPAQPAAAGRDGAAFLPLVGVVAGGGGIGGAAAGRAAAQVRAEVGCASFCFDNVCTSGNALRMLLATSDNTPGFYAAFVCSTALGMCLTAAVVWCFSVLQPVSLAVAQGVALSAFLCTTHARAQWPRAT